MRVQAVWYSSERTLQGGCDAEHREARRGGMKEERSYPVPMTMTGQSTISQFKFVTVGIYSSGSQLVGDLANDSCLSHRAGELLPVHQEQELSCTLNK